MNRRQRRREQRKRDASIVRLIRQQIDDSDMPAQDKRDAHKALRRPVPRQWAIDTVAAEMETDADVQAANVNAEEFDWADLLAPLLERLARFLIERLLGAFG